MGIMTNSISLEKNELTTESKEADRVKCVECQEGIYIPLNPDAVFNYSFTCNKCGGHAHFDKSVIVE